MLEGAALDAEWRSVKLLVGRHDAGLNSGKETAADGLRQASPVETIGIDRVRRIGCIEILEEGAFFPQLEHVCLGLGEHQIADQRPGDLVQ